MPTVEELLAVAESDMDAKQTEQYPIEVLDIDAKTREIQIPDGELLFGVESDEKCYVYDFRLNFIGVYTNMKEAQEKLHRTFRGLNTRCKEYYLLQDTNLERILKINKKSVYHSIVITDIETHEKYYFYSKTEAAKFFNNKVNITQAIQKNWTIRGKYKVRILNYKKLIGMLDL